MIESMASTSAFVWLAANGGGNVVGGVNNNTDFLRAISGGTVYGGSPSRCTAAVASSCGW